MYSSRLLFESVAAADDPAAPHGPAATPPCPVAGPPLRRLSRFTEFRAVLAHRDHLLNTRTVNILTAVVVMSMTASVFAGWWR